MWGRGLLGLMLASLPVKKRKKKSSFMKSYQEISKSKVFESDLVFRGGGW